MPYNFVLFIGHFAILGDEVVLVNEPLVGENSHLLAAAALVLLISILDCVEAPVGEEVDCLAHVEPGGEPCVINLSGRRCTFGKVKT